MRRIRKRSLAVLTAGAMLLTSFNMPFVETENKAATKADMTAQESTSSYGLSNPSVSNDVTTWDCIYLGNYWQNDTDGDGTADQNDEKQPIKWRVLSVDGDDAFVIADMALDCQQYNETNEDTTWETCTLRTWLNGTFMNNAFSMEEKSAIKTTTVVNEDNIWDGTSGGNTTSDKIFLLSQNEVKNPKYGFDKYDSDIYTEFESRLCKPSAYAVKNGCWTSSSGTCHWFLRSPGYNSCHVISVDYDVRGYLDGYVNDTYIGVRPVLTLNLSSSSWKYVGKMSSDGNSSTVTAEPAVSTAPTKAPQVTQTPSVSPTSTPSATATTTITPQPATTPANTGNQDSQSQQQTPQAGANTDTTTDTTTEISLIKQSKVSWKSVKNIKSGKVVANWKKAAEADGYQIQYASNKKFKKAKSKTVKSTSVTLKKLKKKTTYFVRVRAYKAVDEKKVYGKWSSVKKVKIKK